MLPSLANYCRVRRFGCFEQIIIGLLALLCVDQIQGQTLELTGQTMGPIEYRVLLVNPTDGEPLDRSSIAATVGAELELVNRLMSTYRPDSDVSRFNQSDSTEWFPVDALTAEVVGRSIQISEQTDGAFDITVGPAVAMWNFGAHGKSNGVPSPTEIDTVKQKIGYQLLSVRKEPPALKKQKAGVEIDLSAIAKGYAVDRVALALERLGLVDYMVEVGGEVRALGKNDSGTPWRIGIEKPTENSREVLSLAGLEEMSLATSGDYRSYRVVDGKRFSHTIDPRTSRPVELGLASASVVCPDCMTADALATAMMVIGSNSGKDTGGVKKECLDFCRQHQIEAFFVLRDRPGGTGPSALQTFWTDRFPLVPEEIGLVENEEAGGLSIWPALLSAVLLFGLAILAMAVGTIFANKPIQGSCGGLSTRTGSDGDTSCSLCQKPVTDCSELDQKNESP